MTGISYRQEKILEHIRERSKYGRVVRPKHLLKFNKHSVKGLIKRGLIAYEDDENGVTRVVLNTFED